MKIEKDPELDREPEEKDPSLSPPRDPSPSVLGQPLSKASDGKDTQA